MGFDRSLDRECICGYKEAEKKIAAVASGETVGAFLSGNVTEIKSDSATVVRANACSGLTQLVSVTLPNVTAVENAGFSSCTALASVDMPSLTKVYNSGFSRCENLSTLKAGHLTALSSYAFYNCYKLESVDLSYVTTFTYDGSTGQVFQNCKALKEVVAPLVTLLPTKCFEYCSALKKADFTALEKIDDSAFANCSSLTALILRKTDTITLSGASIFSSVFTSTPIASGTGYIYVPAALVDTYKADSDWKTYANQFRALEDYTVDGTVTGELDESKI